MIKSLSLAFVLNSSGQKSTKISIITDKGTFSAIAPAGTSKGSFEAKTLDAKETKKIFPELKRKFIGMSEREVDSVIEMIGIEKMGSGVSTALSMAAVRAATGNDAWKFFNANPKSFPYPLSNIIGGGEHDGFISEQELLVIPTSAKTVREAVDTNVSIWKEVGMKLKPFIRGRNRESAWMCKLDDIKSLDALSSIAEEHGAKVGIDFAANSFYRLGEYSYKNLKRKLSKEDQIDFVLDLIDTYKLAYVEDPVYENDFESFAEITRKTGCLVVGDDLFVTNASRLSEGVSEKAGNAIIIKPNQAGTVSRTMDAVKLAAKNRYTTIVSHRSGETNDSFISDLALGIGSPIIKIGARGKDESKHKRLIELWDKISGSRMASFPMLV